MLWSRRRAGAAHETAAKRPFRLVRRDAGRETQRQSADGLGGPGSRSPAAERAAGDLLNALGADTASAHLRETPRRVAAAYAELLTPAPFTATTFPNDGHYDELVLVRDIPFQSLCAHHLLPFHGTAHVAYLPGERIIGLSKLGRVVDLFARDLQVQERLTTQVADWIEERLAPHGVGVIVQAEHLCMSLRGVQKPGALTVTSALRGSVKADPSTRHEFLSLVAQGR